MTRAAAYRTAADTARSLGVTVRALRVYERHGLSRPGRNAAGWRVYGPDDLARLHQILALKRLGLPLARIGALLKGGNHDLDRILSLQEADLVERKTRLDRALGLVRRARARLARGEALPTDDLIQLTKETVVSDFKPTPEFEALVVEHVPSDRVKGLHPGEWTAEDQARVGAEWAALIADAERLAAIGDPGTPEALDLARRWRAQVMQFTKGDAAVTQGLNKLYDAGFSKPEMQMPFSGEVYRFMAEAQARLGAEG